MKTYIAKRYEDNNIVIVVEAGSSEKLEHRVKHSPDGFEWGYGGSGPADLARSILWDHLGKEPTGTCYQAFKQEVVAAATTDEWSITTEQVAEWVVGWMERTAQPA